MAKKDNQTIWIAIAVIALVLFIYGGKQGWFQNINIFPKDNVSIEPDPDEPVLSSCSQVCAQQNFNQGYAATTCKAGETRAVYGYPGEPPLLTCCCYNTQAPNNSLCSETDGGMVEETPGITTFNGDSYMDKCQTNTSVYEYYCEGNVMKDIVLSCAPGQTCIPSRSGGYCHSRDWNPGDTVFQGGGNGAIVGGQEGFAEIDLSDYGIETGGNCQLGARITMNWNYGNSKCVGIPGAAGMQFEFYDSLGLEYTKIDATPASWTVDLHPRGHILSWDGHTKWKAYARQFPFQFPECVENYDYTIKIYIYECL